MQRLNAVFRGYAFDFIGPIKPPFRRLKKQKKNHSQLLRKEIVNRLNRIDFQTTTNGSQSWGIDIDIMSSADALREIKDRVHQAQFQGVNVSSYFDIDEMDLRRVALQVARLLHETRAKSERFELLIPGDFASEQSNKVLFSLPGFDMREVKDGFAMSLLGYEARFKSDSDTEKLIFTKPGCSLTVEPNAVLSTIPGYEELVMHIGLPGEHVIHVARWFKKALLQHERQVADYFAHCMRNVGKSGSKIVSSAVLASRGRQIKMQMEYAANHHLTSTGPDGKIQSIPFLDPVTSAEQRSAKIYVQLKGLDLFSVKQGLAGFFITLTLRATFHPNPSKGRCSWDGATPRNGHDELQFNWRNFQRRFGKTIGVRVEEPHEDGCPHWHVLIYIDPSRESDLRSRIGKCFGEGFAADVRAIDRDIGSGASYLMKYIRPALIDSLQVEGSSAVKRSDKAARYDAHRATWGGRTIQIFDVPGSSTKWTEMRRIKESSDEYARLPTEGQRLHKAATTNDYCEFLLILLDMRHASGASRVKIKYGNRESGSKMVQGICVDEIFIDTHKTKWSIEPIPSK